MNDLKSFLNEKALLYENQSFIDEDPILIPHRFSRNQDIEIAGLIAATLAWGQRKTIIKSASKWIEQMDHEPFDFIMNATDSEIESLHLTHRTFNDEDVVTFTKTLQRLYRASGSLEHYFMLEPGESNYQGAISRFHKVFFEQNEQSRTKKHLGNPSTGSSAKRMNMYLRWMIRSNQRGVDFGIWSNLSPAFLSCPLDVHTGNVARKLELISRKANDQISLKQLDDSLRKMDAKDPVKYDFALFGLGVYEKFGN